MNTKTRSILKFNDKQFVTQLGDDLVKFGRVKVAGLGYFSLLQAKARRGFHLTKRTMIDYPEYIKIRFSPSKTFKEKIKLWK